MKVIPVYTSTNNTKPKAIDFSVKMPVQHKNCNFKI